MEIISLLFPTIFFIVTLVFTFLIFENKKSAPKLDLPPGSNGWPLLGETYDFLSNPEKFIHDRMNKYSCKIFKTRVLGEATVVLCGTKGNKFLGANEEKLFKAWRPHSMQRLFRSTFQTVASLPSDRKMELHALRAPGFLLPEALARYMESMDNMIQSHLKIHWKGKQTVNIFDQMKLLTATISCNFYLGLQDPNRIVKLAQLLNLVSKALHCMTVNFPGTTFYLAKKASDRMRKELLLIIKEKKDAISSGRQMKDILTYMIVSKGHNGEFMPDHEIADKVMGLLIAGFTTPASSLTVIMKFISERAEVFEKIRQDQLMISHSKSSGETLNWNDLQKMKYTWNVCLEVMRLVPPFQGTFREAITDITYEGYTIPKGWKIYWSVSSTNKDREYFPNPDEFVDTRFEQENFPAPYTNVPFGGGPRICPGKEYARLVILTFLHYAVRSYKWKMMYPNEKIIVSMIPIPVRGLPVHLMSI